MQTARKIGIAEKLVIKLELWATDVMAYRADMGYWDASKKSYTVNNQWVMALPPSAQALVKLWEECIIQAEHDAALKGCKVAGVTISDGFMTSTRAASMMRRECSATASARWRQQRLS